MSLRIDEDTIWIGDKRVELALLYALLDTNNRYLWQFIEINGVIQAVPYSEQQVIWIDKREMMLHVNTCQYR